MSVSGAKFVGVLALLLLSGLLLAETTYAALPETLRVSVSSTGEEGNGDSRRPTVSNGARYIAFESQSSNLAAGDNNGLADIFVRDRYEGTTKMLSKNAGGQPGDFASQRPSISADGSYVAFESAAQNLGMDSGPASDVFVANRETGVLELISQAAGGGSCPSISANGRFVAFVSEASTLVAGDNNDERDVFVKDRTMNTVERVSVSSNGVEANGFSNCNAVISGDGRYVAFASSASNLVSDDGNGVSDIFVRDRLNGTTIKAFSERDNLSFEGSISQDGRYVTADPYLDDLQNGTSEYGPSGSKGNILNTSSPLIVSSSGRYLAFPGHSPLLAVGGSIFVRDRERSITRAISLNSDGWPSDGMTGEPYFSPDEQYIAYSSTSNYLVADDKNGVQDIFVRSMEGNFPPFIKDIAVNQNIKGIDTRNVGFGVSLAYDPEQTPLKFSWEFGDGGYAYTGSNDSAVHLYQRSDTYTITVTATDADGESTRKSKTVSLVVPEKRCLALANNAGIKLSQFSFKFGKKKLKSYFVLRSESEVVGAIRSLKASLRVVGKGGQKAKGLKLLRKRIRSVSVTLNGKKATAKLHKADLSLIIRGKHIKAGSNKLVAKFKLKGSRKPQRVKTGFRIKNKVCE